MNEPVTEVPGAARAGTDGGIETRLVVENLHVELDTEGGLLRAVDAVRLTLRRGETFALVGESGCGKSMTALALMRLLPENGRIAQGRIDVEGTDVVGLSEREMRGVRGGRIGMVFQEPATSLNPVMRVGDQLLEAIEAHTPLRGRQARVRALEWLGRVGLPEPAARMNDYPFTLSGGQKQRVMIAMMLAAEPEFLLADEPTTALDVSTQAQILDLLRDLQRERGLGLMLITHDLAVVAGMAQRVALMYAGEIVEVAEAAAFFAAPKHPYARMLLRALPDVSVRRGRLAAIAGSVPSLTDPFEGCRFASRCDRVFDACRRAPVPMFCLGNGAGAEGGEGREVRCLLHAPGAVPGARPADVASQAADAVAPADAFAPDASPTRTASELLRVEHLSVRFPIRGGLLRRTVSHATAVDDVSFTLEAGRTLALVGESGSGKTTLGKAVVQLLRGTASTRGRALLEGHDLFSMHGRQLLDARRKVQIIFQDPFASLDPRLRVAEALEEGLLLLRPEMNAAARRDRIHLLLEQVGLRRDVLERWPHEFSGGQRQRIAIARALAVEPKLIVCDEPTSALDVSVQAQILNLLRDLQQRLGVSILFISHHLGVVEYLAHDVAVMRQGCIEEIGPADQVLKRPASAYTKALLDAVPRIPASRG